MSDSGLRRSGRRRSAAAGRHVVDSELGSSLYAPGQDKFHLPVRPKRKAIKQEEHKEQVKRAKREASEELSESSELPKSKGPTKPAKKSRKSSVKTEGADVNDDEIATAPLLSEAEMYAFEGRRHWVGAHVSVQGGVENSVINARLYGCQAWALFLKPKMQWECKSLTDDNIRLFREWLTKFKYDPTRCLPHGSYLVNLANPNEEKRQKSLDAFVDDLKRCALLKIGLYNFHPGSGVNECTRSEACTHIANSINTAHAAFVHAVQQQGDALYGLTCPVILLENMAGQGAQIGGTFEELAEVIAQVHDKSKVGVCIDTAHAFASGMDIRTKEGYEEMMSNFDRVVGLRYLKGMHINDSAAPLGSHRDRHANLGGGHLGLVPFHCIMNDERCQGIPLVLETPAASWRVWQGEIQALYALQGLDVDDRAGWEAVEAKLAQLRSIEKEMEKGNSLADASKAARRALEGKPPPTKGKAAAKRTEKAGEDGQGEAAKRTAKAGEDGQGEDSKAGVEKRAKKSKRAAASLHSKNGAVIESGATGRPKKVRAVKAEDV